MIAASSKNVLWDNERGPDLEAIAARRFDVSSNR